MKDSIPYLGGAGGFLGILYALGEFSIHNIDVMMAALGPFAFRIAPHVGFLDAQTVQQIYIALAVVSGLLAAYTLAKRAQQRFGS